MTNNDERNEAIAKKNGLTLLQAEINLAIVQVMGLTIKGTVCYHGIHPPIATLHKLVAMKAEGFALSEERFNNHVKIMACHGLVHNTDEGNKIGHDYLAKQKADRDPHNRIEDN